MDKLMRRLAKQMEDIDRQTSDMEQNFEVMDLSPMFKDLNMIDEAKSRGITINPDKLSQLLNVPVIETIATQREGLKKLWDGRKIFPDPDNCYF